MELALEATLELGDISQIKSYDGTAARILEMLGNGLAPAVVSSALGVSESYISQLLGEESFNQQVTGLRYANLQAATSRDRSYDSLEDALLVKMAQAVPMLYKPMEIVRMASMVNAMKRRGADAPENTVIHQTTVQLTLPIAITSRFITNSANQVIEAGDQELITIAASSLNSKLDALKSKQIQLNLSKNQNDNANHTNHANQTRPAEARVGG